MQMGHKEDKSSKKPPFREDLGLETEEWLLLGPVTKQQLVKTLRDGKDLACALVNCKV
jgi:hypothetical protein